MRYFDEIASLSSRIVNDRHDALEAEIKKLALEGVPLSKIRVEYQGQFARVVVSDGDDPPVVEYEDD